MASMFFKYYAQTYRIDRTPGGRRRGTILNLTTGLFEEDTENLGEVLGATTTSHIKGLSEERFVQETEIERNHFLSGDGPIFALYETVNGLYALARKEERRIGPQEIALIRSLYQRTFKMWEEEAARRAAGEPPSFEVTSMAVAPEEPSSEQ